MAARRNQVAAAALTDDGSALDLTARLLVGYIVIVGTGNCRATEGLRRAAAAAAVALTKNEDAGSEPGQQ